MPNPFKTWTRGELIALWIALLLCTIWWGA